MFLLLLLLPILFCTPNHAVNDPRPTCSPAYGTTINPADCDTAIEHPFLRILWTRMGNRNAIKADEQSVLELDWNPLIYHPPLPPSIDLTPYSTTITSTITSPRHAQSPSRNTTSRPRRYQRRPREPVLLDPNLEVASDSGLLSQYRLSRACPPDDLYCAFQLPIVNVHGSCAIGIDLANPNLSFMWKASERPLEVFRALEGVVHNCTGGEGDGTVAGQGGVASTPRGEMRLLVTEPALLADLPLRGGHSLEAIVERRLWRDGWRQGPPGTWVWGRG